MEKKLRHVRVGDPITDTVWNEVTAKLNRSKLNVASCGMLGMTEHPQGRTLSLRIQKPVPARLIGSSSPYSWTALIESSAGTYADRVAGLTGGTSNAYEVNGKAGLGGKPVLLTWTAAGDWRFQWVGYGCKGNVIRPRFVGCFDCRVVGINVDILKDGVVVFSGVTNSLGEVTYSDVNPGDYDISWSIPFSTYSGTMTVTITSSCNSQIPIITLSEIPGSTICYQGCPVPYPVPLYVTDALGTRALGDCVTCVDGGGTTFYVETLLSAAGPIVCGSPKWRVQYLFNTAGCPSVFGSPITCEFAFTGDCSRPISIASSGSCSGLVICGITSCLIHT